MRCLVWACLTATVLGGCAANEEPREAAPSHPFPKWVEALEPGKTSGDEIRARFGEPDQVEGSVRSGTIWRYAFPEASGSGQDSDRPKVSADGMPGSMPNKPSRFRAFSANVAKAMSWTGGLVMYPPRQSRPPRTRMIPATIHDLELLVEVDGTLKHVRYAPRAGTMRVPEGG